MKLKRSRRMRWIAVVEDTPFQREGEAIVTSEDALKKNIEWMAANDWGLKEDITILTEDLGEAPEDTVSVRFTIGPYPSYIGKGPTTPPWAKQPEPKKEVPFWNQLTNVHLQEATYHVIGSQGSNLDLETSNV